ncbi:Intracellular exo-alpha-(1-_5)-L-arabinofuranosidase [compost metagenome]
MWCLGNEMDGPWQIGQKTAEEYGRIAYETAKAMRAFDKSIELVVCGSSSPKMATYPAWEATVLDYTYDSIDYISLHMYFDNHAGNTADYLAQNTRLDDYIATIAGVIAYTKAKKRSKKDVYISFDEWNVWYHSREADRKVLEGNDGWPHAPALLEDIYNFEDVLQVGCILNTFIRRSDVVKVGCLAQLVNVIAPIMTVPGGPAWRQTTFFPYAYASQYGRGKALQLALDCPGYSTDFAENVAYLDVSAVETEADGALTFFIVSRHQAETIELDLSLEGFGDRKVIMDKVIEGHDLRAANGPGSQAIEPRDGSGASVAGRRLVAAIAPLSYRMIRLGA